MVVMDPVKLVIKNYPKDHSEMMHGENNPEVENGGGYREIPFSSEIWIEREDFLEDAPKKFFRLGPGLMVRLKNAYIVKCDDFLKDENGRILEIHCSYIPESKSGADTSGIHVKGTIHWVSVKHAKTAEIRLYDRLFRVENPSNEDGDFKEYINPDSLAVIKNAFIEPDLFNAQAGVGYQFIRKGYFALDPDSQPDQLVFNRTVTLKDAWAKEVKKG
jgi:glutaminyl-tRNA synthetase